MKLTKLLATFSIPLILGTSCVGEMNRYNADGIDKYEGLDISVLEEVSRSGDKKYKIAIMKDTFPRYTGIYAEDNNGDTVLDYTTVDYTMNPEFKYDNSIDSLIPKVNDVLKDVLEINEQSIELDGEQK